MPPGQAAKLLGAPISTAASSAGLSAVPLSAQYLYPDTNDYYYRYGGDYLYRVDRSSSLIDALLPLAFGGYSPGSYLPNYYMGSSYFPSAYGFNNYGFNSFYPASYGAGYGYGYDNLCNRYVNGTIYQVDCVTGMIVDVIPLYAGGYGVGQLLPTGYGYYNVPYQYRDMYYDTSNSGYWYAPGAIYQYDPSSSMITSVAALLSPGFNIGQPLPLGYDAYNVPYGYRSTYYDTPNGLVPLQQRLHLPGRPHHAAGDGDRRIDFDLVALKLIQQWIVDGPASVAGPFRLKTTLGEGHEDPGTHARPRGGFAGRRRLRQ